jgi:hypothetical protein
MKSKIEFNWWNTDKEKSIHPKHRESLSSHAIEAIADQTNRGFTSGELSMEFVHWENPENYRGWWSYSPQNNQKPKIPHIEILDKTTREITEMPAKDFMNPKGTRSDFVQSTGVAPMTFNQSYTMLLAMLYGEVFQNLKFAARLKDVPHIWEW